MTFKVNESLLEMHFYEHLRKHYKEKYGLSIKNIFKPSTQEEAWIGFDSAWIKTKYSKDVFRKKLDEHIQNNEDYTEENFLGFFLQFKTVQVMKRKSKLMPASYKTPYYRSRLSTKVNSKTLMSQHQILKKLDEIPNTKVAYSCGMIFDTEQLEDATNLSSLRMVSVTNAPWYTFSDETHYITFRNSDDPLPQYNSEPKVTECYSLDEWLPKNDQFMSIEVLNKLLDSTEEIVSNEVNKAIESKVESLNLYRQLEKLREGTKSTNSPYENNNYLRHYADREYLGKYSEIIEESYDQFPSSPLTRKYSNVIIIEI